MKITGSKASVFFESFDDSKMLTSGQTEAGKWYFIFNRGAASGLPLAEGFPFRAPEGGSQITLSTGDKIYPLDPDKFCKTSASLSAEEGSVDAGDDCDPGATILDGIVKITGSLAGLFRYDDQTGEFDDVTGEIINRFFDIVEDDGSGEYTLTEKSAAPAYLLVCLNSNAKAGQVENWLFLPIIISSMSMNLGNTDIQNRDLSWSKGEGRAVIYKRLKAA